jgi:hypothetical protein
LKRKFFVQSFLGCGTEQSAAEVSEGPKKTVLQECGLSLSCHRVEECEEDKLLVPDGF